MIYPPVVPNTHGELVQSLNLLDTHLAETRTAMRALIGRYAATFISPQFNLEFHTSAGVLSLRWRTQGPTQRYFELCGNPMGERMLQQQAGQAVQLMLDLDRKRVDLNFTYQAGFYLRKRLRGLHKKRAAAKALRTQYGARAARFA